MADGTKSLFMLTMLRGEINTNKENVNLIFKRHFDTPDINYTVDRGCYTFYRAILSSCGFMAATHTHTRFTIFVLSYGSLIHI